MARPKEEQIVIRRHPETGEPVEGRLRWGLIPNRAPDRPAIQPIHARAETIAQKLPFRDAYRRRRCIVPMDVFYQKDAQGRRHAIARPDSALFGAAGIWDNWRDPETGLWERTFAIVTVPANATLKPIHDRMLLILDAADFARWLGPEEDPRDLMKPCPPDWLSVRPVG